MTTHPTRLQKQGKVKAYDSIYSLDGRDLDSKTDLLQDRAAVAGFYLAWLWSSVLVTLLDAAAARTVRAEQVHNSWHGFIHDQSEHQMHEDDVHI